MAPPVGTLAPRTCCERLDGHQQSFPTQQPGNFSLDVQDRMGGVQLASPVSHFRLELVHLTLRGLPRRASDRVCSQALKPPHAAPCATVNGSCTATKQEAPRRAACSSLPPPESAVDTRGELAPLRLGHDLRVRRWPASGSGPGGLVATLLDPQGRSAHLLQCHRFLSAVIGIHLQIQ